MKIPFGRLMASARLMGSTDAPCLYGTVRFYRLPGSVLVAADVRGLPKTETGIFGFHIHDGGSCGGEAFSDAGAHYNPLNREHPSHAGDLPPLFYCQGRAFLVTVTDRFTIPEILGKTVLIHADPDDFHTQPAGNAGARIGCGIICAV